MKPEDFYTVPRSEEGRKVPLLDATGADSGEWLLVVGPDSAAFVASRDILNAALAGLAGVADNEEREVRSIEALLASRIALVIGWSFPEPFTAERIRRFLENAPQVAAQVPKIAGDRTLFFGPASRSSTRGPASNGASGAGTASVLDNVSESLFPSAPPSSSISSKSSENSGPDVPAMRNSAPGLPAAADTSPPGNSSP